MRALADALALAEDDRLGLIAAAQSASAPPFRGVVIRGNAGCHGEWGRLPSPPRPPTRLIGREREVAEIAFALRSGRHASLTLTGPGGVGKTRLAIAAAEAIAGAFPDGVAWVELAHIVGPADDATSLVAGAIARALGTQEPAPQALAASLAAAIGSRKMALVLDNFEHLLGAAPLIAEVLAACPELVVLVTSRERLHLRGEREFAVQPLRRPRSGGGCRRRRDRIVQCGGGAPLRGAGRGGAGDFVLTEANAPAVAELCRRLDGLPLAIELAVRWVKVLPPEALAAQLAPRLPLLAGGAADLPDRQRTMRDTIAWSYALLPPEEQRLFRRLGVFAGGFTLEAASCRRSAVRRRRAISTHPHAPSARSRPLTLALVAALVDKSLVRPMAPATAGTAPRFGMLETIREFALEQLAASGEETATRAAHARYCAHLVETRFLPRGSRATGVARSVWRLRCPICAARSPTWWSAESRGGVALAEAWQLLAWSSRVDSGEALRWLEAALTLERAA